MRGRNFGFLLVWTVLAIVGHRAAWGYRQTRPPVETSVNFQLYRNYLIVVQGSVGPLKGLRFLLDTGTNTTVLSPELARKLHLDAAPTSIAVLGGSVKGETATAPSLQFGPVRSDNVSVIVENLSFIDDALPVPIDAILGLDVLGQSSFVIDYASHEIRFGPAPPMPGSIQLQLNDGLAFIQAEVNHTQVRLLVDTAAPSLLIFQNSAARTLDKRSTANQPSPKRIGDYDHTQVRQISFRLGEVEFGNEAAFVVPNSSGASQGFDGLMSPVALGFTRLAVDLNRKTMTFAR